MKKKTVVKCGACGQESCLKDWKKATIKNNRFVGGCPTCKGEFYDTVTDKSNLSS